MDLTYIIVTLVKLAVLFGVLMTTLAYLQWIERKVIAHIQLRPGPYRVGPHGLLQPLADVIKLITKEGMIPSHVNKFVYLLAPFLAVTLALVNICVMPFGPEIKVPIPGHPVSTWLQMTDLRIGVIFVLAIGAVGVYGVALAGWSSNNKYSLIGGLRSSAQMISYELPMALAIACPLLLANTLSFRELVLAQGGYFFGFIPRWNLFQVFPLQIVAFIVFLIASFAETNRIPFDLPEAENELVAGFHTEYSSMSFASFFMAEYCNMLTAACVTTLLFLGGWQPLFPAPWSDYVAPVVFVLAGLVSLWAALNPARPKDRFTFPVVAAACFGLAALFLAGEFVFPIVNQIAMPLFWFGAKTFGLLFVWIWVRGTLPRFRYDQLMRFAWTFMFPLGMVVMLATAAVVAWFPR
ncbi:MAG TPA: complex I subunit 1 family protein [Bryobacteraceae bacterium]|nr:complex I subunit 1 family protein [Bryobacteraceae bacterium]